MTPPRSDRNEASRSRVLVLGIYLTNELNNIDAIISNLAGAAKYDVVQRWIALGGTPRNAHTAAVTVRVEPQKTPKFRLLNDLLGQAELERYEYVVVVDDDIVLPDQFLDDFLTLQGELDFAIAQPARTSDSYFDHPIVEQQKGVIARQTMFVEPGPIISFHQRVFQLLFPFDPTSPMGWGYPNVWSHQLACCGMRMGVIDILPVRHSLRKPVALYSWDQANADRVAFLRRHAHFPLDECFRVLAVITLDNAQLRRQQVSRASMRPLVSVIIPTYDRFQRLTAALQSLSSQTLSRDHFEIIVVDDGSTDASSDVCRSFSSRLPLTYVRLDHSGMSAAKHAGLFCASGLCVLFFGEDQIADRALLQEHADVHIRHQEEHIAVFRRPACSAPLEPPKEAGHVVHVERFRSDHHAVFTDHVFSLDGHVSLKRSFLVRHGGFKQHLLGGMEDRELQSRLQRFGLEVVNLSQPAEAR